MKYLRYVGLVFVILGAVAIFILTRGKKRPGPEIATELRAIKAEAEVQKLHVKMGQEAALKKVEADHTEALQKLSEEQKKEAEVLKKDPAKLTRFLIKAAR